ncbi:Hexose carrier protein HEX6 [Ananas comosus]|uniref:Hexose carrier protein HEX6 n=1 Tax=Ananas comosus TaxID=4615 RepID=A0A199V3C5_ANACO|nr:Hexose carrier protein HEX6 [Ananas comosus]
MSGGYNGRMTPFVVLSCMVAASGGILFGYDLGISGGVTSMEAFLKRFFPDVYGKMRGDTEISNYCKFDSQLLTVFTSSLYVAGLVSTLVASSVSSRFGRRTSMLVGGAVFVAGSAIGGAALNVYMLILGRVLLGVATEALGTFSTVDSSIPVGNGSTAIPRSIQQRVRTLHQPRILIANLVNYGVQRIEGDGVGEYPYLSRSSRFVSSIRRPLASRDPSNVLQRSADHNQAKVLLQRLRGTSNVQKELDDLISASAVSRTIRHPFRNITKRKYRPQLVMAILIPFFNQITGINVINFYAPVMFRTIGLKESTSLMSTANIPGHAWRISKVRTFLLFGGWVCVMTVFVYFLLPETKKIPMEQMEQVWRRIGSGRGLSGGRSGGATGGARNLSTPNTNPNPN